MASSLSNQVGHKGVSQANRASASHPAKTSDRVYRLVDQQGLPHPVLDDLYDTLESAWSEAITWWTHHQGVGAHPIGIGVEVSTSCGSWRTLRHPGV